MTTTSSPRPTARSRSPEEADYTFNFRGDDGFMFRIKAASGPDPKFAFSGGPGSVDEAAQNIIYFPVGTGDADTRGIIHLLAGVYHLEYMTWEGGGGFWYQVTSAKGFFGSNGDTSAWRAVGFTSDRTTPIPYPSMVGDWTVLSTPARRADRRDDLAGADAAVDAAVAADAVAATSLWPIINFTDPEVGGTSRIPGDSPGRAMCPPDPDNGITGDDDNFAMRMSGTLHIPEDGTYLFGFQGDDGARITIGGVHDGFTDLVENLTGAAVIGRANTPVLNSGSAGAAANSNPDTSVIFQQPGALAGSDGQGGQDEHGGRHESDGSLPGLAQSDHRDRRCGSVFGRSLGEAGQSDQRGSSCGQFDDRGNQPEPGQRQRPQRLLAPGEQ